MIVTLVGSVRFEKQFIEAQRELSRRGILAFSLAVLPCHRKEEECWEDGGYDKTMADLMYFYRIMNSDVILVLGDGYIGESSSREILWAGILGKKMYSQRDALNKPRSWDDIVITLRQNIGDDTWRLLPLARSTFQGDH